jgi:transcription elongation GreA/GreB family factor
MNEGILGAGSLAMALLGHAVGDVVRVGTDRIEITAITLPA